MIMRLNYLIYAKIIGIFEDSLIYELWDYIWDSNNFNSIFDTPIFLTNIYLIFILEFLIHSLTTLTLYDRF